MNEKSNICEDHIPLANDFYSTDELNHINNYFENSISNIGNLSIGELEKICYEYHGLSLEKIMKTYKSNPEKGHSLVTNRDVFTSNPMSREAINNKIDQLLDISQYEKKSISTRVKRYIEYLPNKIKSLLRIK